MLVLRKLRALLALLVLIAIAACVGDDQGAGGGGGGERLDEAASELLECRTADLYAGYIPSTGFGGFTTRDYTPPGRFPIPASVPAVNPHPNIQLTINYYLLAARGRTDDIRSGRVAGLR